MKVDPNVLNVFGEKSEAMETVLNVHRLTAVSVALDEENGQYRVIVITPYPLDYHVLNEAQNSLRLDLHLPVFLESFNPDHPVARTPIEIANCSAFHLLVVRTLREHRLFRPRFGGPPETMVITVTVGEPFDWGRITAAEKALNKVATFDIQIEPRGPTSPY